MTFCVSTFELLKEEFLLDSYKGSIDLEADQLREEVVNTLICLSSFLSGDLQDEVEGVKRRFC